MTEAGKKGTRWWLWGCGCLLLAMVVVTGFCAVAGVGIVGGVFGSILSSDVVKGAVAHARANPAVVEALGEPIQAGWYASGSLKTNGPSGSASLEIPVSGPKGRAKLTIEASLEAGKWRYQRLEIAPEQGKPINLLDDISPGQT